MKPVIDAEDEPQIVHYSNPRQLSRFFRSAEEIYEYCVESMLANRMTSTFSTRISTRVILTR